MFLHTAPPTFIKALKPYTGAMAGTSNISLSCQVECKPICTIFWLKDGTPIGDDDVRYSMSHMEWEKNYAKNDFQSVSSTLVFNIEKWRADGQLNRVIDNANYTCQSQGNLVGNEGVKSTTYFRVECKFNVFELRIIRIFMYHTISTNITIIITASNTIAITISVSITITISIISNMTMIKMVTVGIKS